MIGTTVVAGMSKQPARQDGELHGFGFICVEVEMMRSVRRRNLIMQTNREERYKYMHAVQCSRKTTQP
jgi:hypothetical protein